MMFNAATLILLLAGLAIYVGANRLARRLPKPDRASRLGKIKTASFIILCLLGLFWPLGLYSFVAFLLGWPLPAPMEKIIIAPGHLYGSVAEVPPGVLPLWVVQQLLNLWGGVMFFRLFWLYAKGILFSKKNISCIRFYGWLMMIDWFIDLEIQGQFHDNGLSTTPLFVGLLVIFVAWIMDEGRKIQEEQELTV